MNEGYKQMVEGCIHHDEGAMKALYYELSPMLWGICVRYARDNDEAKDLLQDGIIRVYEKLSLLKCPERLRGWAYSLMVNYCIDYLRRRKVEKERIQEYTVEEEWSETGFTMEEIVKAMDCLSPSQRLVFNMCCVEEMDAEKVAEKTRTSLSNVRALLCRAKMRMRKQLNIIKK